jgi:hypothetical protein
MPPVLDIYGSLIGQSAQLDEAFILLRRRIDADVRRQVKMTGLLGSIEMLRSASNIHTVDTTGRTEDAPAA